MKKFIGRIIAISLILGTFMFPTNTASALSKCEKVKNDVLNVEKAINSSINNFKPFSNRKVPKSVVDSYQTFVRLDYAKQVWKIGTNNPICFSNTQKKYIKKLENYNYSELISILQTRYSKDSKICTEDVYKALYSEECVKEQYAVLTYVSNWTSIFLR